MSTCFKAAIVAAACALSCASAMASSNISLQTDDATGGDAVLASSTQTLPTAGLLARSVDQVAPMSSASLPSYRPNVDEAKSTMAFRRPVFGDLKGNADLLLWNLCSVVRAQQHGHAFEKLDSESHHVRLNEEVVKVSAVPLPGVVWLFVMGVMGLAGTRVTGLKGGQRAASSPVSPTRWPHLGAGAAA